MRRSLLAGAGIAMILPACGGGSTGSSGGAPIRIGVIDTISGPFAEVGSSTVAGAQVAINEINRKGGVKGRQLQLVVKDEQLKAPATVQALRDLQGQGVTITMGYTSSADCLAAVPVAAQNNMLVIGSNCIANDLTSTKFDKHFFRVTTSDSMMNKAAAAFAKQKFGDVSAWDAYAPDYVTGHNDWGLFQSDLAGIDRGVKFGTSVFAPLTAQDVRTYVDSLNAAVPSDKTHGLYLATFGSSTAAVVKQGKPAGLFSKFRAVINMGGSEPTARQLGADFPDVYFVYDYYNAAYQNDLNTSFVSEYKAAKSGTAPNSWSYEGYSSVYAIAAGVQKAGGTDTKALIPAMEGMSYSTPKGQVQFRATDHETIQPVTVFECRGDASASQGYTCPTSQAIPADQVS